jgi:hypothetical protein
LASIAGANFNASSQSAFLEAGIPPAEDLRSDHTQQDDQQQTGSNAKGGEESDSHNASFILDVLFARK